MLYNRLLALKPTDVAEEKLSGLVRLDQARLRRAHRHHCRHVLPRRGLVLLPARRRDRVRRPDHPPARRQVPELHGAGGPAIPARRRTASTGWRCCARPPATRRSAAATSAAWCPSRWRPSCCPTPASRARWPAAWASSASSSPPCAGSTISRPPAHALEFLDEIRDDLEVRKVKAAIANGELHRFNDFLQRSFGELTRLIAAAFFGQRRWSPAEVDAGAAADVPSARPERRGRPR